MDIKDLIEAVKVGGSATAVVLLYFVIVLYRDKKAAEKELQAINEKRVEEMEAITKAAIALGETAEMVTRGKLP